MKSTSATGLPLTVEQRRWKDYAKRLKNVKPIIRPLAPQNPFRKRMFKIAMNPRFDNLIILVLVINGCFLAATHYDQPSSLSTDQEASNVVFSFIFMIEAFIKLLGLGPKIYFGEGKNNFDFVITVISLCDTGLSLGGACTSSRAALLQLVRSLRVFRTVRLVNYLPGIETIYTCIFYPLPLLGNVFLLLLVVIFIYGNMGVQFFAGVELPDNGSMYSNFNSLSSSMQLLFVMSCGGWSDIMEEVYYNTGLEPIVLLLYFGSFVIVVAFLLVNMFVMFIVETFELLSDPDRRQFDSLIPEFQRCWAELDPHATGNIPFGENEKGKKDKLLPFLKSLPEPLGIPQNCAFLKVIFIVDLLETQPNYDFSFTQTLENVCTIAYRNVATHVEIPTLDDLIRKVASAVIIKGVMKKWVRRWKKEHRKVQFDV